MAALLCQALLERNHFCTVFLFAGSFMFFSAQRSAVAAALAVGLVAGATAQETAARRDSTAVANDIRQTVQQLQNVRRERRDALQAHNKKTAALRQRIAELEEQSAAVFEQAAAEQQQIAELESETAAHRRQAGDAASWIADVADHAQQVARRVLGQREGVATAERTRHQRLLKDALRSLESTDPKIQIEGIRSLLATVGQQWPLMRSVTLSNQPLLLDGGARLEHGWVVEVGSAAKVFVSEDQRLVGVWTGDPENPWTVDLPDAVRRQIIELVGIVRETRPPALTPLPIAVPPVNEGASQ